MMTTRTWVFNVLRHFQTKVVSKVTLTILMLLFSLFSYSQKIYVVDGDTFHYNGIKIRLYCIDAPELKEGGGKEAKQKLKQLLSAGKINIEILSTDRYGRKVCKVIVNNKDVSFELVKLGYARVYKKYCKCSKFYRL